MSYVSEERELEAFIRHEVASGFETREDIAERAIETYGDSSAIGPLVETAFADQARERAAWPEVTDCDRLDSAFSALEGSGIVARQHFTCCQTCGMYEIRDEIAGAREEGRAVDGFVFYHWQDSDRAIDGGGLSLRYGSTRGSEHTVEIGDRIVAALEGAALAVEWNRDPSRVIAIAQFDWKRRSLPPKSGRSWTAETCVEDWCNALPRVSVSDAAALVDELPLALIQIGAHKEALAWGHAPFVAGTRAVSLGRIAVAQRSSELLAEAWETAPWGRAEHMVELLIEGGLGSPRVRELARSRITDERRCMALGAAAGWYAVLEPDHDVELGRARAAWKQTEDKRVGDAEARVALAAALWRLGGDDAALMRTEVFTRFSGAETYGKYAVIAAATTLEDLLALVPEVEGKVDRGLRLALATRLDQAGATDAGRALANDSGLAIRFALLTKDDALLAEARAQTSQLDMWFEEGLVDIAELRSTKIALALANAHEGDVSGARAELAEIAKTACEAVSATGRESALARLEGKHDETEPDLPDPSEALTEWQSATTTNARFKKRRAAREILRAAASIARKGDRERARDWVTRVTSPYADHWGMPIAIRDDLVAAHIALGELDRVAELAEGVLSPAALAAYTEALVAAGDRDRAIAVLGDALGRATTRDALLALMPGVLAVAPTTVAAVRSAWQRADEALAALCRLSED